ncbi:MAG TPA: hypothetical protein VFI65_30875 [Streptosporangiaceae bacterium]|nr:hypothetical protein [Streptosporangiaceae bacterium]
MRIPISYVVFRSLVSAGTVLVLLLVGLGLGGFGPFSGAGYFARHALNWLSIYTGVPL